MVSAPEAHREPAIATADLSAYAPLPGTEYVYRRTGKREPDGGTKYPMRFRAAQRAEGLLAGTLTGEVQRYLQNDDNAAPPLFTWPQHLTRSHTEFFLTFDPPIVQLPRALAEDGVQSVRGRVRTFNYRGRRSVPGDVTRTIKRLPDEAVSAAGKVYADCVRLELRTRFDILMLGWVEAREQVWLARGVGEVRRTQQWDGFVLLTPIHESWDLQLTESRSVETKPAAETGSASGTSTAPLETWAACAVFLEPGLPAPRLQGLVANPTPGD